MRDGSRPPRDQRHTCPSFEVAVLAAAKRSRRFVAAESFNGVIFVTIVNYGSVVAAEDDERVSREIQLIQHRESRRHTNLPERLHRREVPLKSCQRSVGEEPAERVGHAARK